MQSMTTGAETSPSWSGRPPGAPVWDGYRALGGSFDELMAPEDGVRPHWRSFVDALELLGGDEIRRRWEESQDLIRQNGVTYNVYGDPRGMDRPWQLDPIPLLISPDEWRVLEDGLIQRAPAAGPDPRRSVRSAAAAWARFSASRARLRQPGLPSSLPRNAGSRATATCISTRPTSAARPMARSWFWATAPRRRRATGYALENRLVLSRMLPDVFRDCQVQRLAPFFQAVRDILQSIAPHNRDNPRVVLLTPGPYNETYFEHAFLAGYLGYTLVEGGDLLVRGNRVYLKLLGGLQPVDVILRRVDDDYCDPLELRGNSFLGVPGLLQVLRAGNVAMANALGSGLVETPALLAYLPAISRELLGEDLKLPWAESWWCGEPVGLGHVLAKLLADGHQAGLRQPPVRAGLRRSARLASSSRSWPAGSAARPGDFVGQEQVALSSVPVMQGERLQSRYAAVRVFLTARDGTYAVMPGGLTRVAGRGRFQGRHDAAGRRQQGHLGPGRPAGRHASAFCPHAHRPLRLSRAGGDLSSRHADNFYWLGRYVERAESVVRLLRGILVRLTEKSGMADVPELPVLLRVLTAQTQTFPGILRPTRPISARSTRRRAALGDLRSASGPAAWPRRWPCLQRVASKVRDRISVDMWRALSHLMVDMMADLTAMAQPSDGWPGSAGAQPPRRPRRLERCARAARRGNQPAGGLQRPGLREPDTRPVAGPSSTWAAGSSGRSRRPACSGARWARRPAPRARVLEALLEIADSTMTYRRRYLSTAPGRARAGPAPGR